MPALLLPKEILSMPAQAARLLTGEGDGDCALLYLALLEQGDVARAQAALHWGQARLDTAYGKLTRLELAAPREGQAPPRQELPAVEGEAYTKQDILAALEGEPEFTGLYREVERQLGRPLSEPDLRTLYALYDQLALPVEVIVLLVGYVVDQNRRQKQNPQARPRMAQIRKEAYVWKRLGLDSHQAAEEYLRRQQQVDGREWAILSAVGVTQRRPAVEREREYISAWVELGLGDELIAMAYQRTVYQKGQMNWPYMNKILLSWHQAGWTTPEQVKAGDRPAPRQAPKGKGVADYQPTDQRVRKNQDWLDQFLQEQERKGE